MLSPPQCFYCDFTIGALLSLMGFHRLCILRWSSWFLVIVGLNQFGHSHLTSSIHIFLKPFTLLCTLYRITQQIKSLWKTPISLSGTNTNAGMLFLTYWAQSVEFQVLLKALTFMSLVQTFICHHRIPSAIHLAALMFILSWHLVCTHPLLY